MAAWSLHWKQYHQTTCQIFQQNMALYILLLLHMLISTGFSQSYQEQLNLIPMAYCIVQLWHFIWTLLLQHLALICLNNYWDILKIIYFSHLKDICYAMLMAIKEEILTKANGTKCQDKCYILAIFSQNSWQMLIQALHLVWR